MKNIYTAPTVEVIEVGEDLIRTSTLTVSLDPSSGDTCSWNTLFLDS